MERWEVIERFVLIVIAALLVALGLWLLLFRSGPERFAWLALLTPCIFWIFWQALYEDKIESTLPPSSGEYLLAFIWFWSRRMVLGAISGMFAVGCLYALVGPNKSIEGAFACGVLSFFAGWVALFGGGKGMSMSDDLRIHRQRRNRYK